MKYLIGTTQINSAHSAVIKIKLTVTGRVKSSPIEYGILFIRKRMSIIALPRTKVTLVSVRLVSAAKLYNIGKNNY